MGRLLNKVRVTLENTASDLVDVAEALLNWLGRSIDTAAEVLNQPMVKLVLVYTILICIILFL